MNYKQACKFAFQRLEEGASDTTIADELIHEGYVPRKGKLRPGTVASMASKYKHRDVYFNGGEPKLKSVRKRKRKSVQSKVNLEERLAMAQLALSSNDFQDEEKRKMIQILMGG